MDNKNYRSEKFISKDQSATHNVIFVNGPPASGKSSIAENLAAMLNAPLLSLDTVKEALFNTLGIGDREYNRKLGRASMAVIWSVVGSLPVKSTVIIDAWLKYPPYDDLIHSLENAQVKRIVEIWCWASGDVLAQRYRERVNLRHSGHLGEEYADELKTVAEKVAPTRLGPFLEINTTDNNTMYNSDEIYKWVVKELCMDIKMT